MLHKKRPSVSQAGASPAALTLEQALTNNLLKGRDLMTHRRLRVAESFRGGGEGARLGNGLKRGKVTEVESAPAIEDFFHSFDHSKLRDPRGGGQIGEVPTLRLYDYAASGNCLKVRILLAHLGVDYERVHTDIFGGDTLTESYAAKNPARQTPLLEVDGVYLPESNAILWYLAEGTQYLPAHPLARASVVRWLHFEQGWVSAISSLRFRLQTGRLDPDDPTVATRRENGRQALAALDRHLDENLFLVDDEYSIADIANYAYVHLAHEIAIALEEFPAVARWIESVESQPGFINDLLPLPESSRLRRGLSLYG